MLKRHCSFWLLVILMMIGILLLGCQKETETTEAVQSITNGSAPAEETFSTPTQSTVAPVAPTDEQADDPNVRYFTLEDFGSIVIGESTVVDVSNITGSSPSIAMMSYGGLSEYPMRDGKCIQIKYTMDFVVQSIETCEPALNLDHNPHNSIGFEDYDEYIAFMQNPSDAKPLSEIYTSQEIKAYIQNIREGTLPLMLPCHGGERIVLEIEDDFPIPSTVYICYDLFAGTSFITYVNEIKVSIRIYALSEEDAAMAKEMSCPDLIAALRPTNLHVDNYDAGHYSAIFEDTAEISGVSRSVLVTQDTNDWERILFVLDDCLIEIYSPTGTVTKDWLKDFSIKPVL